MKQGKRDGKETHRILVDGLDLRKVKTPEEGRVEFLGELLEIKLVCKNVELNSEEGPVYG